MCLFCVEFFNYASTIDELSTNLEKGKIIGRTRKAIGYWSTKLSFCVTMCNFVSLNSGNLLNFWSSESQSILSLKCERNLSHH